MRSQKLFDLLCVSFIVLSLTGCGSASVVVVSPTAPPIPATNTPIPPTNTPEPASPTATPVLPTAAPTPEVLIDLKMELPEGDPKRGLSRALTFGCVGCHANPKYPANGPRFESSAGLPAILDRGDVRLADPTYEGRASTNQEYLIESILLPEVYLVPGDWKEPMPAHIRDRITEEELAQIIAWMGAFK